MAAFPDLYGFLRGAVSKNVGLKLLALALSAGLWWFVAGESNVQVGFSVPLEIRNVPEGMAITNKVESQVDVRITGPSTLVGALQQKDVSAVIDLSSAKAGRELVSLTERSVKVPIGFRVQRIYPNAVEVYLEKLERRRLPVTARIGGTPQLRRRIARVTVDPPSLEVEALPEEFTRIRALVTEEVTPGAPEGVFSDRARVDLPEGHAKIVGNSTVRVTVTFR